MLNPEKEGKSCKAKIFQRCFRYIANELYWALRVICVAADRFYRDNGFSKSASLAYTSLFSLVPFVTLAFGIFASFVLSDEYISEVEQYIIRNFVPAGNVATQLNDFLQNIRNNVTAFDLPMIIFFAVSSIVLINAIENALNEIWQIFEARSWSHRIGAFTSIILAAPVLILAIYVLTTLSLETILDRIGAQALHTFISPLYNYLFPFLMLMLVFASLYYMVPKAVVKFKPVLFASLIASIIFVCAYRGFAFYISCNASYEKLYGALAAIPIFLLWLYIFWNIVLFGAEVSYQAQYLPTEGRTRKRHVFSNGDGQIVLAMQALIIISKAHLAGQKIPNDVELAEQLGCSSVMLRPVLNYLAGAGIISRGGSNGDRFTLLRTPQTISLKEIGKVFCQGNNGLRFPAEMQTFYRAFSEGKNDLTLLDVINAAA